ncbi:MAG: hypothetical protein U0X20_12090 [Caldilineaceae bacterium]
MAETTNKLELPLADVPFDEMIASMGTGIAEAQRRLDEISFEITKMMSGTDPKHRIKLGAGDNAPTYSLLDLGFTPTFYQFVDTTLEIKVAFSMNSATTSTTGKDQQKTVTTKSTPVDAAYANRFQYPVEGSSVLRTKLVTVPPPGLLENRVRELRQAAQQNEASPPGTTGTVGTTGN